MGIGLYYVFAFNLTLALLLVSSPAAASTHLPTSAQISRDGAANDRSCNSRFSRSGAYFLRGEIAKEVSERLKELEPAKFTPSKRKAVKRKTP